MAPTPDESTRDESIRDEPIRDEPIRDEQGMTTAEYSVGTIGAVVIATILFKLGQDDGWLHDTLIDLFKKALDPLGLLHAFKNAPRLW